MASEDLELTAQVVGLDEMPSPPLAAMGHQDKVIRAATVLPPMALVVAAEQLRLVMIRLGTEVVRQVQMAVTAWIQASVDPVLLTQVVVVVVCLARGVLLVVVQVAAAAELAPVATESPQLQVHQTEEEEVVVAVILDFLHQMVLLVVPASSLFAIQVPIQQQQPQVPQMLLLVADTGYILLQDLGLLLLTTLHRLKLPSITLLLQEVAVAVVVPTMVHLLMAAAVALVDCVLP